jgi:hypothetical protein
MNILDVLRTSLLDLLWELQDSGISMIIGGGYGIFLKTAYVNEHKIRTLLAERPESRSTNDLDLFLRPELLIQPGKLKPLSEAINKLGYQVIETAQKYQFVKPDPTGKGGVKIDFLTGPQSCFEGTTAKTDERRVRPNPSVGLHAHPVDEVPTLEEGLLSLKLSGILSIGSSWECEVFLPHPYSFLMMKLFAFRDRLNDESKEFSRYHALDLYSIISTTTEEEWDAFPAFRKRLGDESLVGEAGAIVEEYFSALNKTGILRMRESRYCRPDLQINEFMSILKEAFPNA